MDEIINWLISPKPYLCVATVIIALIVWFALRRFINKLFDKNAGKNGIVSILVNVIRYFLIILCVLVILQINGINVTSAIAGLGIASVIVGLALQDALKDIIMGVNIISENFFRVGDIIKIDNYSGKVDSMSLKSTHIVNGEEGYEMHICNRNIDKVYRLTDVLPIDIPLSYGESREKITSVFNEIVKEISSWKEIRKAEFLGLNEYKDSCMMYRLRINCAPTQRVAVRRKVLKKIDDTLQKNGIIIPYPQMDVHLDK
ncbi:MAG: mechanosensitive ion channel family protein [Clostridiales bacterium]|nr:mechanosensitive ion channel family protein [Clostridiales bacterium]